ncbi:hypothetical protein ACJ65_00715 [Kocuria rhizophila]|nr:hypothetical protein ACJ65_00715 [Kocuria rhizophila]
MGKPVSTGSPERWRHTLSVSCCWHWDVEDSVSARSVHSWNASDAGHTSSRLPPPKALSVPHRIAMTDREITSGRTAEPRSRARATTPRTAPATARTIPRTVAQTSPLTKAEASTASPAAVAASLTRAASAAERPEGSGEPGEPGVWSWGGVPRRGESCMPTTVGEARGVPPPGSAARPGR